MDHIGAYVRPMKYFQVTNFNKIVIYLFIFVNY